MNRKAYFKETNTVQDENGDLRPIVQNVDVRIIYVGHDYFHPGSQHPTMVAWCERIDTGESLYIHPTDLIFYPKEIE